MEKQDILAQIIFKNNKMVMERHKINIPFLGYCSKVY